MSQPTSAEKHQFKRKWTREHLYKYGFLGIILCLLAFCVFQFLRQGRTIGPNENLGNINLGNILIALMLLSPDIAFYFIKKGWKSRVIKTRAFWRALVFVFSGIILCLVFNVFQFSRWHNFGFNEDLYLGSLLIVLALLFHHIGTNFTKTGWKSRVMKTVALVWTVFVLVYVFAAQFRF